MSEQYMKELLRVAVAQICQTIGYNCTQAAPLELLQDALEKFLCEFSRDLRRHVEHYNRTEADLNDVALSLNSLDINTNELLDYINNVEPVSFAVDVPKFPAYKELYLNFLKPGSKEVLSRPVHIYEHLPPMLPQESRSSFDEGASSTSVVGLLSTGKMAKINLAENDCISGNKENHEKSALHTYLKATHANTHSLDDDERPTREISSVVMTTGGFISPAIEGKLPDATIPDCIEKLLGLDTPLVSRPESRSSTNAAIAETATIVTNSCNFTQDQDKDASSSLKKQDSENTTKKYAAAVEIPIGGKITASDNLSTSKAMSKKNLLFPHSLSHMQQAPTVASKLLKKAKKKTPHTSLYDKFMEYSEKTNSVCGRQIDIPEKAQRKYIKILQKLTKSGKVPGDVVGLLDSDKKLEKSLNPVVIAAMPPGPERFQLEKLLKKQAKQRQKLLKQQIGNEVQKSPKKMINRNASQMLMQSGSFVDRVMCKKSTNNISDNTVSQTRDMSKSSTVLKSTFPNALSPLNNLESSPLRPNKPTGLVINESSNQLQTESTDNRGVIEVKLSNEPDRSKLNIFKKISKQKAPKSLSPSNSRSSGTNSLTYEGTESQVINLPSGTTITPAPTPSSVISTPISKSVFGSDGGTVINLDDVRDTVASSDVSLISVQCSAKKPETDLTQHSTVGCSENMELSNKPKKRGRKPGSKNNAKLPGTLFQPTSSLLKKNKRLKLDPGAFRPSLSLPAAKPSNETSSLTHSNPFDSGIDFYSLTPSFTMSEQQLQVLPASEEPKERKKVKTCSPSDIISSEVNFTKSALNVPTSEEVQSINKKLMRMDTVLKPAPSLSSFSSSANSVENISENPENGSQQGNKPSLSAGVIKRMPQQPLGDMNLSQSLPQPFMLPVRPGFQNFQTNMLSMLPLYPFSARPGLIPTPGLFPTPGLANFPSSVPNSNAPNILLPGIFPFPNLKQSNMSKNSAQDSDAKAAERVDQKTLTSEQSYCNVAPLVPEFMKFTHPEPKQDAYPDIPKTPKSRSLQMSSHDGLSDSLLKKLADAHTPESSSGNSKSVPSTPGGISVNTFEQLMKRNDSQLEVLPLKVSTKGSQEIETGTNMGSIGADFTHKKKNLSSIASKNLASSTGPDNTIEVSDDSDETTQLSVPSLVTKNAPTYVKGRVGQSVMKPTVPSCAVDDIFISNTANTKVSTTESDFANKEFRKLKKQSKFSRKGLSLCTAATPSISSSMLGAVKTDGVGKLAGGADLIPLSGTGLAYSAKTIPFNSLTANPSPTFSAHMNEFPTSAVFDNVTITPTMPTSVAFDLQKKRKEHKKLKKLKEGKIKKKKDKKDKSKNKERAEKYLLTNPMPHREKDIEKHKDRDLIKKLKKEKKKEKQRLPLEQPMSSGSLASSMKLASSTSSLEDVYEKQHKLSLFSNSSKPFSHEANPAGPSISASQIPKLTLKIGSTQSPILPKDVPKFSGSIASAATSERDKREPSPELARISPLVTRPPKQKLNSSGEANVSYNVAPSLLSTTTTNNSEISTESNKQSTSANLVVPPPSPWLSGGTISASSVLLPHQLLQTSKSHDLATCSNVSHFTESTTRGSDRQSPLAPISEASRPSSYIDAEGNRVWICPACGKVDDGSPMIGCDSCDAWYHWVCVGIFVAPKDNEDWFCKVCITRKKGIQSTDKKRKRTKKK